MHSMGHSGPFCEPGGRQGSITIESNDAVSAHLRGLAACKRHLRDEPRRCPPKMGCWPLLSRWPPMSGVFFSPNALKYPSLPFPELGPIFAGLRVA